MICNHVRQSHGAAHGHVRILMLWFCPRVAGGGGLKVVCLGFIYDLPLKQVIQTREGRNGPEAGDEPWERDRKNTAKPCDPSCTQRRGRPQHQAPVCVWLPDWLVLQAPHGVFEGDTLVLRCQTRSRETLTSVKYVWNGKVISASNQSQDLSIPRASSNNSGFYHCTGRVDKMHTWRSNTKSVQIQGKPFISCRLSTCPVCDRAPTHCRPNAG